jgi:hypothetical protein
MKLPEDVKEKFMRYGKQGGKKTLDTLGKEHFSRIGKISAERKAKLKLLNSTP